MVAHKLLEVELIRSDALLILSEPQLRGCQGIPQRVVQLNIRQAITLPTLKQAQIARLYGVVIALAFVLFPQEGIFRGQQ